MNKDQELAAVQAAMAELKEYEGYYSISDVADLVGLPIRVVRAYMHLIGCRAAMRIASLIRSST